MTIDRSSTAFDNSDMKLKDLTNRVATAVSSGVDTARDAAKEAATRAAQEAKAKFDQTRPARERAKDAFDQTRPAREAAKEKFDHTRPAREYAATLLRNAPGSALTDAGWGESVPVEDGSREPLRFAFGEHLKTIGEVSTPRLPNQPKELELLGARARVFGGVATESVSVGLGFEAEAGVLAAKDFRGTRSEVFLGARTRSTGEAGLFGQSIGSELFAGLEANTRTDLGDDSRLRAAAQAKAGVHVAARVSNDVLGVKAMHHAEVGVRARGVAELELPVIKCDWGEFGVMNRVRGWAFAGAMQHLEASGGLKGVSVSGEGFAGARAGASIGQALTWNRIELAGLEMRGEAWAGAGVRFDAGLAADTENKTVKGKLNLGAALGIGGSAGVDVTLGGSDLANVLSSDE